MYHFYFDLLENFMEVLLYYHFWRSIANLVKWLLQ
jgi:hypothetical protein